jgi:hypothetical protein
MMVAVSIQVFRHPSTGPFTTAVQPGTVKAVDAKHWA